MSSGPPGVMIVNRALRRILRVGELNLMVMCLGFDDGVNFVNVLTARCKRTMLSEGYYQTGVIYDCGSLLIDPFFSVRSACEDC